jgi:hypothetical protein
MDGERSSPPSHKEEEDGGSLSDDSDEVIPISRPLSPSKYLGSLMKHSGSREKLFAQAATEPTKNLGSTSLPLSPSLPLQQGSTTDKEGDVRGTAGGDRLPSSCPPSQHFASLPTVNCLLNSVVSTHAFFGTMDLTDFYLGASLPIPQFIRIYTDTYPPAVLSRLALLPFLKVDRSGRT